MPPPGTRVLRDSEGCVNVFPQRPDEGAPVCDFFTKTGHCKFGEACRFHHPLSAAVKLTAVGGYPLRQGQPVCPFYDRTGMFSCQWPDWLHKYLTIEFSVSCSPSILNVI